MEGSREDRIFREEHVKQYRVTVLGIEYIIGVEETAAGEFIVQVGDRTISVSAEEILEIKRPSGEIIQSGSQVKDLPKEGGEVPRVAGGVQVTSPMPGNVVSVVAKEGQPVQYGVPVIVLEAMKMRYEIPSPVKGIVLDIRVKEGDAIDSEDVIAVIQEAT